MPRKCIVLGCSNHSDEGRFIGALCAPCYAFVARGEGTHSQGYRNAREVGAEAALETVRRVSERLEEVCVTLQEGLDTPPARHAARGGGGSVKPCTCTVLTLCPEATRLREAVASLSCTTDGTGQVGEALAALTAHRRAAGVVPKREERTVCPAGHVLAEVGVRVHGRWGQAECRECERGRRR